MRVRVGCPPREHHVARPHARARAEVAGAVAHVADAHAARRNAARRNAARRGAISIAISISPELVEPALHHRAL